MLNGAATYRRQPFAWRIKLTGQSGFPSFRDGQQDQTSDVQLHIGESRLRASRAPE
jgi:hypothetical protein